MKRVRNRIISTCFVLFLLMLVWLTVLRWLAGPGEVLGAFLFLLPLEVSALGVIAALAWFTWLSIRFWNRHRTEAVASSRTTLKRAGILAVSLLLALVGVLSGLVFHLGTACLMQRVEAGRVHGTVAQLHGIELACMRLLADAQKDNVRALFIGPDTGPPGNVPLEISWNTVMPQLLLEGRNAKAPLIPDIRAKLATQYTIQTCVDAWGHPFEFSEPPIRDIVAVRSLGPDGVPSSDDISSNSLQANDNAEFYDGGAINRTPFARLYRAITGRHWVLE